jgi:hypothetical protein
MHQNLRFRLFYGYLRQTLPTLPISISGNLRRDWQS